MARLKDAILGLTGDRVAELRPLHGGDLSDVWMVTLQGGDRIVAKEGTRVATEARMLAAMAETGAPVPEVIAVGAGLFLMEALEETGPGPGSWEAVGRALAAIHGAETPGGYGWDEDYAFGAVSIPNGLRDSWPDFWAEQRLLTHLPHLPGGLAPRLTRLIEQLPRILPAAPRPALLHGDLWNGNLLFGPTGTVHFIDPAAYRGDPEVDLAMLHLFGAPGPGFSRGYGTLDDGWERRRAVYSLWPALVHLRLFGASYRGMVERLLTSLGV